MPVNQKRVYLVKNDYIIDFSDPILITGAAGFIGRRVVETLLRYGFINLRCLVRPSSDLRALDEATYGFNKAKIQIVKGNLLSPDDCKRATQEVSVIFHLAAGVEKSFPGCFMNSVVATRNLLDSILQNGDIKRFLNVSSLAVYSNNDVGRRGLLDETSEVEKQPELRHEAYSYGKIKQDELLLEYSSKHNIPFVIVRPGEVYGPGKRKIPGRVGIDTFSVFLHLGGPNPIPLTYVDNCAEAIVLAGIKKGVNGETFNIVDDDLPASREFLRMYKRYAQPFVSIYMPYKFFYFFCYLWEKYSVWSHGQLPPAFNRKRCVAHWKPTNYSNRKIKDLLDWKPEVPLVEGLNRYFDYMKATGEDN
jgi:nucleoside-diphosphate-sugar epimerase